MSEANKPGQDVPEEERVVLCGANAYDKKYYFNELFKGIPASIQEELHIICVLFTEEIGGIFTIEFDENGNVELRTEYAPEDYLYDDIGSGLLISEVRRKRQELFESLSLYYKAVVLHEDMSELLDEEGLQADPLFEVMVMIQILILQKTGIYRNVVTIQSHANYDNMDVECIRKDIWHNLYGEVTT